jgi:D-3-phosphoglycerate dehydrogenase
MDRFNILITARSFCLDDADAWELLHSHGCNVIHLKSVEGHSLEEQLVQKIGWADGIIAGLETYDVSLLRQADRLKGISRYGVGYDAIDLQAASQFGIKVTNTPGANVDSVADLAVALMLAAARHIPLMDTALRGGTFRRPLGMEMFGKTLGVIGTGRIGAGVVKRCCGFSMDILCYDVRPNEDLIASCGVRYVGFDDLVEQSDFITIHTPLTAETRNLFNAEVFARMKPRSVLVNTARGGIIDESALATALKEGRVGAAALDVIETGIFEVNPLLSIDTCIVTPHAGAATYEASNRMSMMAAQNLLDLLYGRPCPYAVN